MFPDSSLSSSAIRADYLSPDSFSRLNQQLTDRELGGVALGDPSQGLNVHVWRADYVEGEGIRLTNENTAFSVVYVPDVVVTEVALAFDQNMRPSLAYVRDGVAYLLWYDSALAAEVTTIIGQGVTNPMLTLDDKRKEMINTSDIVLAYLRDKNLYWRVQRERFLIEHFAAALPPEAEALTLLGLGMNAVNRVQLYVRAVL